MRHISLKQFAFDPKTRILSADISDLGPYPLYQVYNDACDEGMTVVSHHTGIEVTFVVNRVETDGGGDILKWELVPTDQSLRLHRHLAGMSIYLYND